MNAQTPVAGQVGETHALRRGGLMTAGCQRILDRIDGGLIAGSIEARLPDGSVRVLGGRSAGPLAVLDLHRWRALLRMMWSGSIGCYEGWAAGDWSSPDPVPLFELFMRNRTTLGQVARAKGLAHIVQRIRHSLKDNHRRGAQRNILAHYDLGNDFYAAWLDPTMSYSGALFAPGDTLEAAQRRKQAAILDRLQLGQGSTLLEIGCGWGSLAQAAHDRGAEVCAVSLSPSQLAYARSNYAPGIVFDEKDYRDLTGQYDAIASVEMAEAVGEAYWPAYIDTLARCLKPGGRAALQFITIADDVFEAYRSGADFIQTYVFPGGMLISESRFRHLAEARGFDWVDRHGMAVDYAETLKCWRQRFDQAMFTTCFDQKFINLWRYYLMYCEGGFRSGGIDVAQVTLLKRPRQGPDPSDVNQA
jgi:cyclopropane-fatty-acyl-phospholipid synthase